MTSEAQYDEQVAAEQIVACFRSLARSIGSERAKRLFVEFANELHRSKTSKPRGRPKGRNWTKNDLALLFTVNAAPPGKKTKVRDEVLAATGAGVDGNTAASRAKYLQRLRRAWKNEDPGYRQHLIESYFAPKPSQPAHEVFGPVTVYGDSK